MHLPCTLRRADHSLLPGALQVPKVPGGQAATTAWLENGAPSSGKTTIASAFRDERASVGDFWLVTGIDDYLAKLPAEWRSAGGRGGPLHAADGIRFDNVGGEVRVSVGSIGRLLLRTYQASVAAAGRAGLNVMVDEVVIDRISWGGLGHRLGGSRMSPGLVSGARPSRRGAKPRLGRTTDTEAWPLR